MSAIDKNREFLSEGFVRLSKNLYFQPLFKFDNGASIYCFRIVLLLTGDLSPNPRIKRRIEPNGRKLEIMARALASRRNKSDFCATTHPPVIHPSPVNHSLVKSGKILSQSAQMFSVDAMRSDA